MTKKEIQNIINLRKIYYQNNRHLHFNNHIKSELIAEEAKWLPNISELKEEITLLNQELTILTDCIKKSNEISKTCTHPVRITYSSGFTTHYECVFCGETIRCNNDITWNQEQNRNKYCVNIDTIYYYDEDGDLYLGCSDEFTIEQVFNLIQDLIKDKNDNDEIDLVQEFKKLNNPYIHVNTEKFYPTKFILILGGSNKIMLDDNTYLYKENRVNSIKFLKYFSNLSNVKIKLIDNPGIIHNPECIKIIKDNNLICLESYNTLEELNNLLKEYNNPKYNLIINISNLFNYKIKDNKLIFKEIKLNFNDITSNQNIFNIYNYSNFDKTCTDMKRTLKK